ncbi:MAG: hypothetical protein Q8R18_00580 [bacterium]|nr:hypothetical protein [bacterium]
MITKDDQDALFQLIARNLKKDVQCYAFGGNAMMYYGYKAATKDIDILFENIQDKKIFVDAITSLNYQKMSLKTIYPERLEKDPKKPEMYTRGDERFDLFVGNVFRTVFSNGMKERVWGRYDFKSEKYTLTVYVLGKEDILFLKGITHRDKDFEDIKIIVEKEKKLNWEAIIDEAIYQHTQGNDWAVLDLEETLENLKKNTFLKKEYFDRLYSALKKKN